MNEQLEALSAEMNLSLSAQQSEALERFASLILEKNETINLVSRKDIENIWTRHIGDSLAFLGLLGKMNSPCKSLNIADIGAGGGFPSIPLAIMLNDCSFTMYESSLRKYEFLLWACMELKLENVKVFRKRVEKNERGEFDFCLERAAGEPEEMIALCKNLCAPSGLAVIWQYGRNLEKIQKTNPPYFIYNYSIGKESGRALLVFRRA